MSTSDLLVQLNAWKKRQSRKGMGTQPHWNYIYLRNWILPSVICHVTVSNKSGNKSITTNTTTNITHWDEVDREFQEILHTNRTVVTCTETARNGWLALTSSRHEERMTTVGRSSTHKEQTWRTVDDGWYDNWNQMAYRRTAIAGYGCGRRNDVKQHW